MDIEKIKKQFPWMAQRATVGTFFSDFQEDNEYGVSVARSHSKILIGATQGSKEPAWLFRPAQARAIAAKLIELADKIEGKG